MTRRLSGMGTRLLILTLLIVLVAGCIAPQSTQPVASGGDEAVSANLSTIMAPANPGGGWDQTSRLMAQVLQEQKITSGSVEVVNVPGAGGTVGLAELVTQHASDSSMMMMMGKVMLGAILTNKAPVSLKDATPLARLTAEYEAIVVPADSPFQTVQDLVDAFKADPKSISWAGGSAGGTDHILVGQIANAVGVPVEGINYVAYAGGGEASAAIIGSQVSAGVSGVGEFVEFVASGQMRMLAVSSDKRLDIVADVPTLKESGVEVILLNWRGVVGAPGISAGERAALIDLLAKMTESAAWQDALKTNGWDNVFLAGDDFSAYIEQENETISGILKAVGLVE